MPSSFWGEFWKERPPGMSVPGGLLIFQILFPFPMPAHRSQELRQVRPRRKGDRKKHRQSEVPYWPVRAAGWTAGPLPSGLSGGHSQDRQEMRHKAGVRSDTRFYIRRDRRRSWFTVYPSTLIRRRKPMPIGFWRPDSAALLSDGKGPAYRTAVPAIPGLLTHTTCRGIPARRRACVQTPASGGTAW